MNFVEAIKTCFVRYTDFSGRSIRSEYWNYTVFIIVLTFVCDYIDSLIAGVPYCDYTDAYGPFSVILIHLGKSILAIFETFKNYGASWKINDFESLRS